MNFPLRLLRSAFGPRAALIGAAATFVATVVAVLGLARTIDRDVLASVFAGAASDPAGLLVAVGGFAAAFAVRAGIWTLVAPSITFSHSLASIHVALGANHVLPFRLGEPLRAVSAIRRTSTSPTDALLTGGLLRLADVLALVVLALALGPRIATRVLGPLGGAIAVVAAAAAIALAVAVGRRAARGGNVRRPDPITAAGAVVAWLLEGLLMWQVAGWAGIDLGYLDAVLVTVIAVCAQLVAVAPGGLGTYEAAAASALLALDVPLATAVSIALAAHLVKTGYSIAAGLLAVFLPAPSLFGRLRLPPPAAGLAAAVTGSAMPTGPIDLRSTEPGPVVLFLPAYQEGPRIAEVIARAPATAGGRRLEVIVIDDGSTDDTAVAAQQAGATVVSLETNRGLGAAVALGLVEAVDRFDPSAVVFCDADGEYDPAEIDRLVEPILARSADYVIGSRFSGEIEHMRPHRRFGNQVLTQWVSWMTRLPVTDGQSGYRALSREAAAAAEMAHDYNYAQVLTLDLVSKGFRYHEVPITYRFRQSGDSFVRLSRYLRAVVPAVWAVLNRPASELDGPAEGLLGPDPAGGESVSVLDDVGLESVE